MTGTVGSMLALFFLLIAGHILFDFRMTRKLEIRLRDSELHLAECNKTTYQMQAQLNEMVRLRVEDHEKMSNLRTSVIELRAALRSWKTLRNVSGLEIPEDTETGEMDPFGMG